MSTSEGGSSGKTVFRMRQDPPVDSTEMPLLDELPAEDEVEYVIEDLEAAESPTGGAARPCSCFCYG